MREESVGKVYACVHVFVYMKAIRRQKREEERETKHKAPGNNDEDEEKIDKFKSVPLQAEGKGQRI